MTKCISLLLLTCFSQFVSAYQDEDMKFLTAVAATAGSAHICGTSEDVSDSVLKKIMINSTCAYKNGLVSKEQGMTNSERLVTIFYNFKKIDFTDPPQLSESECESARLIIDTYLELENDC